MRRASNKFPRAGAAPFRVQAAFAPTPFEFSCGVGALTAALVHRALATLSEEQRVAVTLVDLCGFTSAEAAGILGCPRGTVLSRVHRGRKALARLLGN